MERRDGTKTGVERWLSKGGTITGPASSCPGNPLWLVMSRLTIAGDIELSQ